MADVLLVGDGLHGGADEYRADRAALEEDDAEEPGDELGGARAANEADGNELRERLRGAGARPYAHQTAQEPQVEQQQPCGLCRGQRRYQHFAGKVVAAQDERTGNDAAQQR